MIAMPALMSPKAVMPMPRYPKLTQGHREEEAESQVPICSFRLLKAQEIEEQARGGGLAPFFKEEMGE